jgi:hypothetical protein
LSLVACLLTNGVALGLPAEIDAVIWTSIDTPANRFTQMQRLPRIL